MDLMNVDKQTAENALAFTGVNGALSILFEQHASAEAKYFLSILNERRGKEITRRKGKRLIRRKQREQVSGGIKRSVISGTIVRNRT